MTWKVETEQMLGKKTNALWKVDLEVTKYIYHMLLGRIYCQYLYSIKEKKYIVSAHKKHYFSFMGEDTKCSWWLGLKLNTEGSK